MEPAGEVKGAVGFPLGDQRGGEERATGAELAASQSPGKIGLSPAQAVPRGRRGTQSPAETARRTSM